MYCTCPINPDPERLLLNTQIRCLKPYLHRRFLCCYLLFARLICVLQYKICKIQIPLQSFISQFLLFIIWSHGCLLGWNRTTNMEESKPVFMSDVNNYRGVRWNYYFDSILGTHPKCSSTFSTFYIQRSSKVKDASKVLTVQIYMEDTHNKI